MKKIFKTLKKYTLQIIIILLLLILQAICDLAIPDYTSKIVDVGITQNGISGAVFEVASEKWFNNLLLFVDEENKNLVVESYELITKDSSNYNTLLIKYPLLQNSNLYILKGITKDKLNNLNEILVKPLLTITSINQKPEEFKKKMNIPNTNDTDIFSILRNMNKDHFTIIKNELNKQFDTYEALALKQIATQGIKIEYTNIGIDFKKLQTNYILNAGLKMLGLALSVMVLTILTTYTSSKIAANFGRDLRNQIVSKVMMYSNKEFEDFSTASLITRSTNDIQQVQMLITMLFRVLFYAPIMGIGAYAKVNNSPMSWVIAVAVISIMSVVVILFSLAIPKFNMIQKTIDKLNLISREIVSGIPVIRAFATDKYEEKRFDNANKDLTKINMFVSKIINIMMPTMMFIMSSISILIIWVGSHKVDLGTIQIGSLFAFITYTMQIIMAFLMISMVSIMIPRAIVSIKRISEVLNKDTTIKDAENTTNIKNVKGFIEFKDVYFRYPDAEEDVLQNINFKASPGTTTAFIGGVGSGKSTLINLIPRFFDVTGGKILIDDVNIKDLKLSKLRSYIGYVPQKGNLFTGTIESNISFGTKKLTKKELERIANISQSLEFINEKEDGFNSLISQGGTNVSGGQRQRLAIARAIAINPKIYIFDDSFSALDYKTDAKLRKELSKTTKDSTILIVTQRISTILNVDQIIVLDKGEIVGIGNHKSLMKDCQVYKEIASSQLSKEELENE